MKNVMPGTQDVETLHAQGVALYDRKKYAEASAIFAAIMRLKPNHIPSIERLAAISKELGNYETAINLFQAIVDMAPTYAIGYCNLAQALRLAHRTTEAQKCFETASLLNPDDEITIKMMGTLALEIGDKEKAGEYYLKAYKLNPKDYLALSSYILYIHTVDNKEDPYFQAMQKFKQQADRETDLTRKMSFYQAYAKAFKDLGDKDSEFQFTMEAAKMKRAAFRYDIQQDLNVFEGIKKIFTPQLAEKYNPHALSTNAPIFVVGMPRSGSTLTDQILCSHKDIKSIGEADILAPLIKRYMHISGINLPFKTTGQTRMGPVKIAQKYLEEAQKRAGNTPRFVDKSLLTYEWIGLIRATMPNAKIIHIKRNPMDCCVSCFTTIFISVNHAYTYDLKELGTIYRAYMDMMNYWHEQFPGTILDVVYEDLVGDTEGQVRRMLDYLELPWDESCLKFYETERQVRTASITQVRQPIYKSSIEKWRAYERYLEPLIEALGPYGPERTNA